MEYKLVPGDHLHLVFSVDLSISNFVEFTSAELQKVISDYLNNKMRERSLVDG